jgi:hypothetical protein
MLYLLIGLLAASSARGEEIKLKKGEVRATSGGAYVGYNVARDEMIKRMPEVEPPPARKLLTDQNCGWTTAVLPQNNPWFTTTLQEDSWIWLRWACPQTGGPDAPYRFPTACSCTMDARPNVEENVFLQTMDVYPLFADFNSVTDGEACWCRWENLIEADSVVNLRVAAYCPCTTALNLQGVQVIVPHNE